MEQIPFTADLLTTSGMQLAMLVQPLTLPHPSEEPIQVTIIFSPLKFLLLLLLLFYFIEVLVLHAFF